MFWSKSQRGYSITNSGRRFVIVCKKGSFFIFREFESICERARVRFFGKKERIVKKIAIASSYVKDKSGNILSTAFGKYYCLDVPSKE